MNFKRILATLVIDLVTLSIQISIAHYPTQLDNHFSAHMSADGVFRGVCTHMCPSRERAERQRDFLVHPMECDERSDDGAGCSHISFHDAYPSSKSISIPVAYKNTRYRLMYRHANKEQRVYACARAHMHTLLQCQSVTDGQVLLAFGGRCRRQ
jgi:hypothetical protein